MSLRGTEACRKRLTMSKARNAAAPFVSGTAAGRELEGERSLVRRRTSEDNLARTID
jgi:hypothetical protein